MKKEEGLYHTLACVEPPTTLYAAIMSRIDLAKRRAAQMRTGAFAVIAIACSVLLIPILQYTANQFYASGFYDYLSLALSDHTLVMTYWREFALSLLESLPSLALLLLVPLASMLIWSLVRLVKNARTGFTYVRLT